MARAEVAGLRVVQGGATRVVLDGGDALKGGFSQRARFDLADLSVEIDVPDRVEVERIETDLAALIGEVAQAMNVLAAEKRLDLIVCMPATLPRMVRADPLRLRQILPNLLSNAIKFTAQGAVVLEIAAARRPDADDATWLRFSVSDSGVGMTPEQLRIVFEPFRHADGSTTRSYGGTGLGRSIARRFARLMGGDVSAASEPGRSSVFVLELPFETLPAPRRLRREMGLCAAQKALVAVADPQTRRVLVETLESCGALAVGAADPAASRAALTDAQAAADPFDILLFQDVFSDEAALQAAQAAAETTGTRPKPIWVRPSWMISAERSSSSCGAAAILEGPFLPEAVARQIANAVAHRRVLPIAAAAPAPRTTLDGVRCWSSRTTS